MRMFADPRSFAASNQRTLPSRSFFRMSKGKCMAASCVGRNVRQTAGEKAVTLSRKTFGRGRRLITGSDNLLAGVCALISYEYSHFGAQAASSSGGKRAIDRDPGEKHHSLRTI